MLKEGVGLYSDDEAATESFPHISDLSVGELAIA